VIAQSAMLVRKIFAFIGLPLPRPAVRAFQTSKCTQASGACLAQNCGSGEDRPLRSLRRCCGILWPWRCL
jgi:hypothetical protein